MNRFIILLSGAVLCLTATAPCPYVLAQQTPQQVIILHANDMHAKIDNMARLAWLRDSLAKQNPLTFLVSAGDNFTGNPVVDMVADKGYPMIDLMNRAGFELSALGNHEFDMGQEWFRKRLLQARFPFICANLDPGTNGFPGLQPFVLLQRGDSILIPVVSVIQLTEKGLPDSHPDRFTGLGFVDGMVRMASYTYLKEKYGNLVALTHLGVGDDKRLASAYPAIDLVIGGHSHSLMKEPLRVGDAFVVQAGSNLKYVGKTTLTLHHGKVLDRKYELISVNGLTREDSAIRKAIDAYNDNAELKRVLALAEKPLVGLDELGSLMTDALTANLDLDIAFQNSGGIRIDSLPGGEITLKDVYKLDPFGNRVIVFEMNTTEIRSLICYAFNLDHRIDLAVSGMKYTVITDTQGECADVLMMDPDGKSLDGNRRYKVGMNSYMASAYRFDHSGTGTEQAGTTAELLISYLLSGKKINYSGIRRTNVVRNK